MIEIALLAVISICLLLISHELKIIEDLRRQIRGLDELSKSLSEENRKLVEKGGLDLCKEVGLVTQRNSRDVTIQRLREKEDCIQDSLRLINQCSEIMKNILDDRSQISNQC